MMPHPTPTEQICKHTNQSFELSSSAHAKDEDISGNEQYRAEFTTTTRGREQLIFCGQPFIYEKGISLANGGQKKLWRCNQWWNKRCRARVYTIADVVTPLNKYHTHEDIIKRKKRVSRGRRRKDPLTMPGSEFIVPDRTTAGGGAGDGDDVDALAPDCASVQEPNTGSETIENVPAVFVIRQF